MRPPVRLAALLALPASLSAYTDPGSGALILQMLAAAIGGAFYSLRRWAGWFRRKDRP